MQNQELLPLHHREALVTTSAPTLGWNTARAPSPWAPEFQVSEAEGREVLTRLRSHPEAKARIEGMVRVQGNQYGVLPDYPRSSARDPGYCRSGDI